MANEKVSIGSGELTKDSLDSKLEAHKKEMLLVSIVIHAMMQQFTVAEGQFFSFSICFCF